MNPLSVSTEFERPIYAGESAGGLLVAVQVVSSGPPPLLGQWSTSDHLLN